MRNTTHKYGLLPLIWVGNLSNVRIGSHMGHPYPHMGRCAYPWVMPTGSRKRPEGPALHLAGTLRAEISRRNLTKRAVAQAADIPETTLGPLLRGEKVMNIDQLFAIAHVLDLDPVWLLDDATKRAQGADRKPTTARGAWRNHDHASTTQRATSPKAAK